MSEKEGSKVLVKNSLGKTVKELEETRDNLTDTSTDRIIRKWIDYFLKKIEATRECLEALKELSEE